MGFVATDFAALAASFGFSGTADVLVTYKNIVKYMNAHGGLDGHPIKGDYYYISGTAADPSSAYQAACTHFVQDNHDQLVISDGEYEPVFEQCLAQAHVPHFDAAKYGLDATQQRESPYYLAPTSFGVDRYTAAQIETAVAKGWIAKGEKVGVLYEACPADIRTYNNVWVPMARRYGFGLVGAQTVCSTSGQLSNGTAEIASSELKFSTAGAKTISFISEGDGFMAVLFSQAAQAEGWHPLYLLSSISTPERGVESQSSGLSVNPDQLSGIRGVGWVPMSDVGKGAPKPSAAQRQQQRLCQAMDPTTGDASGAPDPGVRLDFIAHFLMDCDTMLIVKRILQADGGSLSLSRILGVYDEVLDSYTSASNLGGKLHPVGGRTDGEVDAAPYAYDPSCRCIRYDGPARPVG